MSADEMLLQSETAAEAQARVIGPLIDAIGLHAALAVPQQLEQGDYVKVSGEWARVVEVGSDDRLRLTRTDSACEWWYTPTIGERFVWHEGPF